MAITWQGRTVLVTGAAGAVGSAVVERLAAGGAAVRALVRSTPLAERAGVTVVRGDLGDPASLATAAAGCDLAVHCAAELSDDPVACQASNVDGTGHLLAALAGAGCRRLVYLSSVSVYDARAGGDFDEDAALWTSPLTAYGYSKAEGERLVRAAPIDAAILRPVVVLSLHPRSYWGPLALARARASAEPLFPLATLPYVHVDNLVTAVELAASDAAAVGRAYNVIDGEGESARYLAAVAAALGMAAPSPPAPAWQLRYSGERIRRELGYAPIDRWNQFLHALAGYSP